MAWCSLKKHGDNFAFTCDDDEFQRAMFVVVSFGSIVSGTKVSI